MKVQNVNILKFLCLFSQLNKTLSSFKLSVVFIFDALPHCWDQRFNITQQSFSLHHYRNTTVAHCAVPVGRLHQDTEEYRPCESPWNCIIYSVTLKPSKEVLLNIENL